MYFSTVGPAGYGLGTPDYERNIIVDCFGVERLTEYQGKERLGLCIVYGADPIMLSPTPGGRDDAAMVTKATFVSLSLPHEDGNFFLRPDRILGCFVFSAAQPPLGFLEAEQAIDGEVRLDAATKVRTETLQRGLGAHGEALRQRHLARHNRRKKEADACKERALRAHAHHQEEEDVERSAEVGHDVEMPSMPSEKNALFKSLLPNTVQTSKTFTLEDEL